MKLNCLMKLTTTALALSLCLAGCEQKTWTHDEIADIAADAADSGSVEEVASEVNDLQTANADLEAKVRTLESDNAALESRLSELEARTPF